MKIKKCVVVLPLVAAMIFTGCKGSVVEDIGNLEKQNVETIEYTDDCQRTVIIPKEIETIVPSGGVSQMILYSIAPEKFAAITSTWKESAKEYIPERYKQLTFLGDLYDSSEANIEELAAINPQLIIDVGESKKSLAEDMDSLQDKTRIVSVHIDGTITTMPEVYRKLGKLLGKEERAEELAVYCEKILAQTDEVMKKVGDNKVKALYVTGEDGLSVLANGTYHAEIFDMLTTNVAVIDGPARKGTGNEVSIEQIALWNPEYMIFAPGSIYSSAKERDVFKELSAITEGKYLEVPCGPYNWMGSPPSVQCYLSMIWLTSELYPEYCDFDAEAEIKEYYRLFYDFELTDEGYEKLMGLSDEGHSIFLRRS